MKVALRFLLTGLVLVLFSASALAQGGASSSISGVVTDTGGGVIPGATVTAKNDATMGTSTVVSAGNGTFTIPSLTVGTYTVTVALQGFKTAVLKGVNVTGGGPASVTAKLEIGGLSETVIVEGAAAVIQTQSSAVSTTLNTRQIGSLPLATRNTLDFITFLPGINTPAGNRDSTVSGLPQSSINITVDGVSVQDNYLKSSDGFFARMSPRLDAVEEVTVTTAGNSADATSQGSTQIRFTTRSGSDSFSGSGYHYYQSDKLNTNTYFNKVRNLPKGALLQNQPGVRVGGPIVIPGVYNGRGKAFFFLNYEELRQPSTITTNSNFMTDAAQSGIFQYQTTTGVQSVNLYALAAANGQTATADPIVAKLLNDIKASTQTTGTVSALDGNFIAQRLSWQQSVLSHNRFPTFRFDYNLTTKHRLNMSYNFNDIVATPDTTNNRQRTFPGMPITSDQISDRYTFQTSMRSVLSANVVNEVRVGRSGGPTQFSPGLSADMWNGSVGNQAGFVLGVSGVSNLTNPGGGAGSTAREGSTRFVEDTLSILRGAHSFSFGMNFTQVNVWLLTQTRVPSITFGLPTGDPALTMLQSTTNFPNSSTAQRGDAQALYALLTCHISAVTGTARLDAATGKYIYNGDSRQEGHLREFDFFAQDSWKVKPNLSVNAGVRYVAQLPFAALNGSYATASIDDAWGVSGNIAGCDPSAPTPTTCNLFKPGTTPGIVPQFVNLGAGVNPYNSDWNNIAASVGTNWTPHVSGGFFRTLLGEQGDTSFSGSWNRAYERRGMSDFTDVLGANPGLTAGATRNTANGNLGALPLLLRSGYLGQPATCVTAVTAACMPDAPTYPIPTTITGSLSVFDPSLQVPFSDTYTAGIQRALGRKSAFEVRYVGSRNREQFSIYNYNETNILENGFLNEFKLAQANLYANIANGKGNTFAYQGPGSGTSPLPIYLAYFSGIPAAQAGDASKYTSTNFASSNYYNALSLYSPAPFTPAGTNTTSGLNGSATFRANAITAGLPRNFFVANPDTLGGANVTGNGGFTKYNSLQTQFRRRLANGLQFDANYTMGKAFESSRYSFRVGRLFTRDAGTPGDVSHAFKATFVYELPFGQGKRFASGAGLLLDRIIGGWQLSGTTRVQSGRLIDLGNVRVNGMTQDDVQKAFKLRQVGPDIIYTWPEDIVDNTIKAYSRDLTGYTLGAPSGRFFSPANGPDCIETISGTYGDCGVRTLVVTGPVFRTMDLSFTKEVRLTGRKAVSFRFDLLNAFDTVNFTPISGVGNTALANYQITGATSGRTIQLVSRFNW